jgi:hypothetical protein
MQIGCQRICIWYLNRLKLAIFSVIGRGSEAKNPLILVGERRKSLSATLEKLSAGSVILLFVLRGRRRPRLQDISEGDKDGGSEDGW